jgi:outer membrane beta-barrel protein
MRKLSIALLLVAVPALAQPKDILEGQPAVRQRKDLRADRLVLGPTFGFTFLEPYKHTIVAGLKAEYPVYKDWLGIGGLFVYGVANLSTGLTNEIAATEQAQINQHCQDDPNPACRGQFAIRPEDGVRWQDAQNSLKFAAAGRVTFTPFSGKVALFSRLFAPFDFYVFGGVGVLGFKNKASGSAPTNASGCDTGTGSPVCDKSLGNDGISIGPNFGGGLHLFFVDWLAFNFEFSDTWAGNNPSGRNVNESTGANVVDGDDKRQVHNMLMLLGASAYFPTEAQRTK